MKTPRKLHPLEQAIDRAMQQLHELRHSLLDQQRRNDMVELCTARLDVLHAAIDILEVAEQEHKWSEGRADAGKGEG